MATITVTSLNDSGAGSLRAAIAQAEAQAGADEIVFAGGLSGTIRLQSRLDFSSGEVSVDGDDRITISGDANNDGVANAGDAQFVYVGGDATVALADFTFTNGFHRSTLVTTGAVIHNRGELAISGSTISNSRTEGATYVESSFVAASTIYNDIRGANYGATVATPGTLTVTDTVFTGVIAVGGSGYDGDPFDNYGPNPGGNAVAGIRNTGDLAVRDVTFGGIAFGGDGGDGSSFFDVPGAIALDPNGQNGGLAVVGIYAVGGGVRVAGGGSTTLRVGADGAIANGGRNGVGVDGGTDGSYGRAVFGLTGTANGVTLDLSSVAGAPTVAGARIEAEQLFIAPASDDAQVGLETSQVFFGGAGADAFFGVGPDDVISMGPGDDTVSGQGDIALDGEAGNDTLVITGGIGEVTVRGGDDAEAPGVVGVDTLRFDTGFGVNVRLNLGAARQETAGANFLGVTIEEGIENLTGADGGSDVLIGDGGANRLEGRGGNDTLFGLDGRDVLIGGAGNDSLEAGEGVNQLLDGGLGDDFLRSGGGGQETLRGGAGDDTLVADGGAFDFYEGGADDDLIQVLGGLNSIDGGAGTDAVQFFDSFSAFDFVLSGSGELKVFPAGQNPDSLSVGQNTLVNVETLIFADRNVSAQSIIDDLTPAREGPTSGDDRLIGTGAADRISGGAGDDRIVGRGAGDRLNGQGGDDTLLGGAGRDTLLGGGGRDLLKGQAGDDLLKGQAGRDVLQGQGGNDRLQGQAGADRLLGQAGNDRLLGQGGNDTLIGGGGRDTLLGGAGADRLDGGKGADVLTGGGGRDRFVFAAGDGADRITDFRDRTDRIEFRSGAESFDDLTLTQQGDDVLIRHVRGTIRVEDADLGDFDATDFIFS